MKYNQFGRSMIEMLGVLAIIGILTVGGFALVTKMYNAQATNTVIDDIGTFANKVRVIARDFSVGSEESPNDFNEYINKGRAFPADAEYKSGSKNFLASSDILYKFSYNKPSSNDPSLFTMEISQLNLDMCIAVLTMNWGSPSTSGFLKFKVGPSTYSTQLDLDDATSACKSNDNTIEMSFR